MRGDGTLSDVRSVVGDVVNGLADISEMLARCEDGNTDVSRGHLEMIERTLLGGSIDVWYRGRYVSIPFRRLSEWFRDPVVIGASRYQVTEEAFRRWIDCDHEHGVGQIFLSCSHAGCKQRRMLTFYDPVEMQQMERRAASETWYCHHHRLLVWESSKSLSDDHVDLLLRVHRAPGLNREQLNSMKRDTDFLMSIGLLASAPLVAGSRRAFSFHLTLQGSDFIRTQEQ
ncbi:hypothetical protein [Burkholderia vietnamiensis]|uniref:hypothetical protein n=1 Tax=Burkholderia vietnamiensis TaxID=60552 RepID=UPI001CF5C9A3|nr:hypothetical protein [Burkholderia vietnamiensis]MCA8449014.1 hypothetical protein [Burkholderia vietnamiensis]